MPRRQFLAQAAGTAAALTVATHAAPPPPPARYPLIVFVKPFQDLGFDRVADVVAEVGWNGLECPVRQKGQVEPERVEEDLPKLQAVLAQRGLSLEIVTTDIRRVDPLTERVLRTAAQLGVKRYRLTYVRYDLTKPIPPQLANLKAELRDLAQLNADLGLYGGLQNHSGRDYIGAPMWDIYELIKDLPPGRLGACFDIGHATLEGGYSWPATARLLEPFFTAVYVKDFTWQRTDAGGKATWGPLGQGMVQRAFFDWLKTTRYAGPISQHIEYQEGAGPEQIAAMKKDLATLRAWLA